MMCDVPTGSDGDLLGEVGPVSDVPSFAAARVRTACDFATAAASIRSSSLDGRREPGQQQDRRARAAGSGRRSRRSTPGRAPG